MPNVEPYTCGTSCEPDPDQTQEATAGASIRTRRRMTGPPTSGGGLKSFAPVLQLQHATTQAYRTIECEDTRMIDNSCGIAPIGPLQAFQVMYT